MQTERVTRTYRQTINASPDIVFPLLCPVREAEWLDGWRYTMLFSQSGLVEKDAVFSTPGDAEEDTVWMVTAHDVVQRIVEFARFTPGSRVCVLRIGVTAGAQGQSLVDIAYTYTSLSETGRAFLGRFTEDAFLGSVKFWEESMNHWLKTGAVLQKRD